MTYEEFLQIPQIFLITPRQVNELKENLNRDFSEKEQEFMDHYQRLFDAKMEMIILKHLKDSLDSEQILSTMKSRFEKTFDES